MTSNAIIQWNPSSSHVKTTYEVFVSFRGDTRNNFTDHLFGALRRKRIHFFKDDTKLKKGKLILSELMQAIEGSQVLVVVFSKGYPSSKWCLRELVNIANSGNHVLPIFYNVSPSEVRNQSGNYEEAFDHYEKRFKGNKVKMEEVLRWREALSQVANLSGWDIGNKPQDAEIEKIVQYITNLLGQNISSVSKDDPVGMDSRVKELEKLLLLDSVDVVQVLGICGMPGIGKTTLVTALWERIYHYFEFHCFIDDLNKIFQDSNTLGMQKQLLCQALDDDNLKINNVITGTNLVRSRLRHGRGLIVLDNVDHIDQLNTLALNRTCLGAGSRIIIISRDEHILKLYKVDHIYRVQPLNDDHASQLFCKYAFKDNYIMSGYARFQNEVLSYVKGHPLAIKVMGSFLFGRDVSQWTSALARLGEKPDKNILDVLRVSFDGLEENEKEIFLDISCFLNWFKTNLNVMEVLRLRGFKPEIGLELLLEKSLINNYNEIWVDMHPLLIDLGKCIVQEKSPKCPRKWSRLWKWQYLYEVMSGNKAAKDVEAVVVNSCSRKSSQTMMKADALSKMSNLKLLILGGDIKFSGSLDHLSNELAYLGWFKYPFKCLPLNFQPNKLVRLSMHCSNIKRLWKGTKSLPNLKSLDLSYSENLVKMPDFGEAPNLEILEFKGCIQLREIHPSIGLLRKLTRLILKNCKSLVSLPTSLLGLNSLEKLNLSGCSNLYKAQLSAKPWDANQFKKLCIGEAPIHSQSASSIEKKSFTDSVSCCLPSSLSFPCMCHLNLSFCNLIEIPDAIGNLCCLQRLILKGNNFARMPNLKKLSRLVYINLDHCKQLKYLPELPSQTVFERWRVVGMPGLCMFNCPELIESERCSRMTISWMIQMIQTYARQCIPAYPDWNRIESVIPGSEIARWFNNEHVGMGNSISVDASPLMQHDNNWIAIMFCVVFVLHCENKTVLNMSLPNTKGAIPHLIDLLVDGDIVTNESDHMVLFCHTRSEFISLCKRWGTKTGDIAIQFGIISSKSPFEFQPQYWHFEVKKYGYRLLYEQDLQPLNITMKRGESSSNRKRKFVDIKEKQ